MRETEIKETNLPKLIVGLDSQNDDANYIHINDVKENVSYYCPCCKGLIKPRAYKKNEKYKIQPHFYHVSGGCTEESYIHYICKNFLFETGSKFIVNEIEYEVKEVITEKGYKTKFGVYIPDITVITTSNKTFYFEIKNTNKKTIDYIPKWDELGNDVVEVDIKQFVNKKFDSDIPEFKLIYSDGECFIREYVHREYEEIEKRKLEWKRQDKLNYKIKWERLDWFWKELQEYIYNKQSNNKEKILESFKYLDKEDMEFCVNIIKKHKGCKELYSMIREYVDDVLYGIRKIIVDDEITKEELNKIYMFFVDNKNILKTEIERINDKYKKYNIFVKFDENEFNINKRHDWIIFRTYYTYKDKKFAIDRLNLYSENFPHLVDKVFFNNDINQIIIFINDYFERIINNYLSNNLARLFEKIIEYLYDNFYHKYKMINYLCIDFDKLNESNDLTLSFRYKEPTHYYDSCNLLLVSKDYSFIRIYYGLDNKYEEFKVSDINCFNTIVNTFEIFKNKVLIDYIQNYLELKEGIRLIEV